MGQYLQPEDVFPFVEVDLARLVILIEDAEVFATMVVPTLTEPSSISADQRRQVKTILRRAVIREADAGTGSKVQESAGPYSYTVDTRSLRGASFLTEDEEETLRTICGVGRSNQVFSVDVTPTLTEHLPWCDLMFGGVTCTCGASLAGYPIYEGGWG